MKKEVYSQHVIYSCIFATPKNKCMANPYCLWNGKKLRQQMNAQKQEAQTTRKQYF